jgi:hypothetical protein
VIPAGVRRPLWSPRPRACWQEALDIYDALEVPDGAEVRARLAVLALDEAADQRVGR